MNIHHGRRHFLLQSGAGLSGLALAWLTARDQARAEPPKPKLQPTQYDVLPKPTAHAPRANAVISMFMQGGPSHIDLFDPKPELNRRHMQSFTGDIKYDNAAEASAKLFGCPWKFAPRGECGMELSELIPALSEIADDICLVRSMHTGVSNHGQSINAMNTGGIGPGRASLGSWITYALGSECDNLPAFVVLTDPRGLPVLGVDNWNSGWLPSLYQGTVARPQEPRMLNLDPPSGRSRAVQAKFYQYLQDLNQQHIAERPEEHDLRARVQSYELAAKMQVAAKEAFDLSGESASTLAMYGLDNKATREYGSRCLVARRLIERGVRFVQIHTGNQSWDHHGNIIKLLPNMCEGTDRGAAALVTDLKNRGLLDTTIVHWGGEMGRLPVIQNEKNIGRDHNTFGFSMWLAGGGFKAGYVHGETDELGHKAVTDVVNHYDYHATLAHLLGLDLDRFAFARPNKTEKLVDASEARVVEALLS